MTDTPKPDFDRLEIRPLKFPLSFRIVVDDGEILVVLPDDESSELSAGMAMEIAVEARQSPVDLDDGSEPAPVRMLRLVTDDAAKGRWYPEMPPAFEGETADQYTDRLTGEDRTNRIPYDHVRNQHCSLGYHDECSERGPGLGERHCKCPCHSEPRADMHLAGD